MSRVLLPFSVNDISALARSLRVQLAGCDHLPGHVELLNMLARSAGHRNFQSFRVQLTAQDRLDRQLSSPPAAIDYARVERLARYFDKGGRLLSWPAKPSLQELCLWVLWSKLRPNENLTEDELNRQLRTHHLFGDHALLRRELCDRSLASRTPDGRTYRRVESRPPPEAVALIHYVSSRRTQ